MDGSTPTCASATGQARSAGMTNKGSLAFLDTETTSLRHDRQIWEFGAILRDPGQEDREVWVMVEDVDLSEADVTSLKIGRFYERHPLAIGRERATREGLEILPQEQAVLRLEHAVRDRVIVGNCPSFDVAVGQATLWRNALLWAAHYQPIDVETAEAGYLRGLAATATSVAAWPRGRVPDDLEQLLTPPYDTDELEYELGMDKVDETQRHTALGDARRVRDAWDLINGRRARL
jgi:hypothetical protein